MEQLLFIGIGIALLYVAFSTYKKYRMVEDTPISHLRTAAQGHLQLQGIARGFDQPKILNQMNLPVVYKSVELFHEVSTTDQQGQTTRRWQSMGAKNEGTLFYLQDPTGVAEVHLQHMDIDGITNEYPYGAGGVMIGNIEIGSTAIPGGRMKTVERCIPEGAPVLLQGLYSSPATNPTVSGQSLLGKVVRDPNLPSFVTTKSEKEMVTKSKLKFIFFLAAGIFLLLVGLLKMSAHSHL